MATKKQNLRKGQTEKIYFEKVKNYLRLSSIFIELCPNGNAPINIVAYAIEKKKILEEIDHIYCVFDRDNHSTYNEAIEKLKNHPDITAITSTPCFEFWLLLHYKYSTKACTSSNAKKELQKYLPEFEKNSGRYVETIINLTEKAITHAKKLEKENAKTDSKNPTTNMHKLLGVLIKMIRDY